MAENESVSSPKIAKIESMSDDEDESLTYEQRREKRLKENMAMFE